MLELPLALRMELLVALLAHADQLPLPGLRIPDAQRQVRPILQVLDVVDDPCPPELPPDIPASDALVVIHRQDVRPERTPLWPGVKLRLAPLLDQYPQLRQPSR